MLGTRRAHRRTVAVPSHRAAPVRVCRRSPAAPLAPPHTQPASAGSARVRITRPLMVGRLPPASAGAMMGWSARPHKAGPRRNLLTGHRVRGGLFSFFVHAPSSLHMLEPLRLLLGFTTCFSALPAPLRALSSTALGGRGLGATRLGVPGGWCLW
jgi:hypothetical protein